MDYLERTPKINHPETPVPPKNNPSERQESTHSPPNIENEVKKKESNELNSYKYNYNVLMDEDSNSDSDSNSDINIDKNDISEDSNNFSNNDEDDNEDNDDNVNVDNNEDDEKDNNEDDEKDNNEDDLDSTGFVIKTNKREEKNNSPKENGNKKLYVPPVSEGGWISSSYNKKKHDRRDKDTVYNKSEGVRLENYDPSSTIQGMALQHLQKQ